MDRNEAQSILGRHSPFPLYDPAEPAVYKDWLIDAMLEAVAKEREACAKVCEAMQDVTEEKRALAAFNAAAGKPSQTAALSRGQHWSAVSLYNCAFRNAAVAIRERLDS